MKESKTTINEIMFNEDVNNIYILIYIFFYNQGDIDENHYQME